MPTYKAATRIKHGMPDGESKIFEVGDTVTGLPKEAMKDLWDAGALQTDDGTTSDALAPDLTKEVREQVNPDDKSVEEIAKMSPDGGKDTKTGTTDPKETVESGPVKSAPAAAKPAATSATKPTTSTTPAKGPAAPKSE